MSLGPTRAAPDSDWEITFRVRVPFTYRGRAFREGDIVHEGDVPVSEILDKRPDLLLVSTARRGQTERRENQMPERIERSADIYRGGGGPVRPIEHGAELATRSAERPVRDWLAPEEEKPWRL